MVVAGLGWHVRVALRLVCQVFVATKHRPAAGPDGTVRKRPDPVFWLLEEHHRPKGEI